jgi:hypothetical protein
VARGVAAGLVVLLAAAVTGAAGAQPDARASAFSYVALGDSYSAGEGVDPYLRDGPDPATGQLGGVHDNRCHRSSRAYPTWVRRPGDPKTLYAIASGSSKPGSFGGLNKYGSDRNVRSAGGLAWAFWACSGAVTGNVLPRSQGGGAQRSAGQHYDPSPQLDEADLRAANLVTITVGGNDAGFTDVLGHCALHSCNTPGYHAERERIIDGLQPRLEKTYRAVAARAPQARILVLGYPQPFPASRAEQSCAGLSLFLGEENMLRSLGERLNRTIAAAVATVAGSGVHIQFVPVAQRFAGHEVCGSRGSWLHGVSATANATRKFRDDESFHPTLEGQRDGYAYLVNEVLKRPFPSPAGPLAAIIRGNLWVGEPKPGGLHQVRDGGWLDSNLTVSSHGAVAATGSRGTFIRLADGRTAVLTGSFASFMAPSFSKDGRWLAFGAAQNSFSLYDTTTGRTRTITFGPKGTGFYDRFMLHSVFWGTRADILYLIATPPGFQGAQNGSLDLFRIGIDGRGFEPIGRSTDAYGIVNRLWVSPDGTEAAGAVFEHDGACLEPASVGVWNLRTGAFRTLHPNVPGVVSTGPLTDLAPPLIESVTWQGEKLLATATAFRYATCNQNGNPWAEAGGVCELTLSGDSRYLFRSGGQVTVTGNAVVYTDPAGNLRSNGERIAAGVSEVVSQP